MVVHEALWGSGLPVAFISPSGTDSCKKNPQLHGFTMSWGIEEI